MEFHMSLENFDVFLFLWFVGALAFRVIVDAIR
jgi:hypothetical protein